MPVSEQIADKSDSLIELLTAQCVDLENLLALARQETAAAERQDFEEVLKIVTERDLVSRRLEVFQRQIGELRSFLANCEAKNQRQNEIAERIIEIANLTIVQDHQTRLLLTSAREEAALEIQNTGKSQRGTTAYLRDEHKGLTYSRKF